MSVRINHVAVWVAAIVYFVFGYLWYGLLFAKPWSQLMGAHATMQASAGTYVISFILGLILAYATAVALSRRPEDLNPAQGISFALFMGIALFATQTLNGALFGGVPLGLWAINAGYVVVGFAIMGAIIGAWKPAAAR